MAHVEHFKMSDIKRLANEYSRDEKYHVRDGRIDTTRTPQNYMMEPKKPALDVALGERMSQVEYRQRKDLNVMSDWVVTCPQELKGSPEKVKRFFEVAYSFTQNRYGKENVLQGFVHMDETTPHVHIPLVPVKDGRINANKLFTRKELSSFHTDLDRVMEREFGIPHLVRNDRTKGNYTVAELKARDRQETILAEEREKIAQERRMVSERLQRLQKAISEVEAIKLSAEERMRLEAIKRPFLPSQAARNITPPTQSRDKEHDFGL